jgi:hypothetical protein
MASRNPPGYYDEATLLALDPELESSPILDPAPMTDADGEGFASKSDKQPMR